MFVNLSKYSRYIIKILLFFLEICLNIKYVIISIDEILESNETLVILTMLAPSCLFLDYYIIWLRIFERNNLKIA